MTAIVFLGITLARLAACSRTTPASMATNEIAAPVYDLADALKQPTRLRAVFSGAVPDEKQRNRYRKYAFEVSQIKAASDSEAILNVILDDGKADRPIEVEWTVVKDGGKWKLKAAPLP